MQRRGGVMGAAGPPLTFCFLPPGAAGRRVLELQAVVVRRRRRRGRRRGAAFLPPSWFCIRALLGLSVHLRVQPCGSTGIKAVCETVAVLGGSVLPPPAAPPQPSPPRQLCLLRELAPGCTRC